MYTPVLAVLVYAYRELSPLTVLPFVPAVAAQRLWFSIRSASTRHGAGHRQPRLEQQALVFASALAAALDARDKYSGTLPAAVAVYA